MCVILAKLHYKWKYNNVGEGLDRSGQFPNLLMAPEICEACHVSRGAVGLLPGVSRRRRLLPGVARRRWLLPRVARRRWLLPGVARSRSLLPGDFRSRRWQVGGWNLLG